jgi:hypothetical protein
VPQQPAAATETSSSGVAAAPAPAAPPAPRKKMVLPVVIVAGLAAVVFAVVKLMPAKSEATPTGIVTEAPVIKDSGTTAGADHTYYADMPVAFRLEGSDNPDTKWEFGDNITGNGQAATHSYANKGTYTVSATAGNTKTGTITINIVDKQVPVADKATSSPEKKPTTEVPLTQPAKKSKPVLSDDLPAGDVIEKK